MTATIAESGDYFATAELTGMPFVCAHCHRERRRHDREQVWHLTAWRPVCRPCAETHAADLAAELWGPRPQSTHGVSPGKRARREYEARRRASRQQQGGAA